MSRGRTRLVSFAASPFPYQGLVPETGWPFLDVEVDGRPGHASARGGDLFADETYSDRRSLLHLSSDFDQGHPAVLILFLHGNKATLERDVLERQGVARQFDASGVNGALVAPQLALDALDSSAGRFWEPGFLALYLKEAARHLGIADGLPVILAAYSGGYHPAAFALHVGGAAERIRGVILLDAVYGDVGRFADWFAAAHEGAFLASAHGASTREGNRALRQAIADRDLDCREEPPATLAPGTAWFIDAGNADHRDFLTQAWTADPLADLLARIPDFKVPRPAPA